MRYTVYNTLSSLAKHLPAGQAGNLEGQIKQVCKLALRTSHKIRCANLARGWFFILSLLFTLSSCTDKFGDIEYINLSFEVSTDKLNLPEGVTVTYTGAVLTMYDYNHWSERLTYPVADIAGSVTLQRGYYDSMRFTATAHYRYDGEDISFPVTCYLNGTNRPLNMIHPEVKAKLPLERINR